MLSDKDNADFRLMNRFVNETANVLQLVQDTLRPQLFDDLRETRVRLSRTSNRLDRKTPDSRFAHPGYVCYACYIRHREAGEGDHRAQHDGGGGL